MTSEEAVETYIEQINRINPLLNALVEDRFKEARKEAKEIDQEKDLTKLGRLAGLPISVKEAFHVRKMTTTGGLEHRKDLIARDHADVIERLRKEGAIILGKTNTSTLSYAQETENKLYGRTNNPWDINRTAGGSSGGEGALLASGGAACGIASDIGGSIRFPSHFNGVVGFKPGKFQVSSTGHYPELTHPLQARMLGIGPMGRSVRDMELIYHIISDSRPKNAFIREYEIEILTDHVPYPLDKHTKVALEKIEEFLNQLIYTKRGVPPLFDESALLWQEMMSVDGSEAIRKEAFSKDRSPVIRSYLKDKLTNQSNVHPYLSWAILGSKMFRPSKKRIREIEEIIHRGDEWLLDYLSNRLLIFPVYHSAAPVHGQVFKEIFSIRKTFLKYMPYVAYANVWGLPALTLPVAHDSQGMPISIQIISTSGNETAIFRLGSIIEKKFKGYTRNRAYDKVD